MFLAGLLALPAIGVMSRAGEPGLVDGRAHAAAEGSTVCPRCRATAEPGQAFCPACFEPLYSKAVPGSAVPARTLAPPTAAQVAAPVSVPARVVSPRRNEGTPSPPKTPGASGSRSTRDRSAPAAAVAEEGMELVTQEIVERFRNFRGSIRIDGFRPREGTGREGEAGRFRLTGQAVAPDGRPMDLVAKFVEALEAHPAFTGVIPSRVTREPDAETPTVTFDIEGHYDRGYLPTAVPEPRFFSYALPTDLPEGPHHVEVFVASGRDAALSAYENQHVAGDAIRVELPAAGALALELKIDGRSRLKTKIP